MPNTPWEPPYWEESVSLPCNGARGHDLYAYAYEERMLIEKIHSPPRGVNKSERSKLFFPLVVISCHTPTSIILSPLLDQHGANSPYPSNKIKKSERIN